MRSEKGIKIGNTSKSGPIIIDPNKEFHSLIIGSTGSGKSSLVFNTIKNILKTKSGKVILIDPHGDTAYKLSKTEYNFYEISGESGNGINILLNYDYKNINFRIAEDFVSILKSTREMQFSESFIGPRIEDLISRGIVAISNVQGATIVDLYNIFKSQESRNKILKSNENQELKKFIEEIEVLPKEEIAGTERALGRLALDPFIRSLICNPRDGGILDKEIDKNDLILINLERGLLGYEDSRILSNILAVYIWFIITSKRNGNYYLFLEEAQDYQSKFISDMVSTGRKFGLRIFFITTSFKVISSNLEALFFSNISNYIVMKLSEPDKVDFEKFMGFPINFSDEQLKFTLISSNTQIKGYTDKVLFESHKSKFKESKYSFLTDTENDNDLSIKISDILSTFESREKTFFIYETFANYLSNYEKSKVISNLKKILKENQSVQYIGRFNIDFQKISGRYEVFLFTGTSSAVIKQSKIPHLFEIYSDYIESLIVTK
ncbi:MAG: helicase HerA domain-containing protein [Thermoplasmata archaeon]